MNQTYEIRSGDSAAVMSYRPIIDRATISGTPTGLTALIYSPDGVLLATRTATFSSTTKLLSWTLDVSNADTYLPGLLYRADLSFTISSVTHTRKMYFDILVSPWYPGVTSSDINIASPDAAYTESNPDLPDYTDDIQLAEDHIRRTFAGNNPRYAAGMVTDKTALDLALLHYTMFQIWNGRTDGPSDNYSLSRASFHHSNYEVILKQSLDSLKIDETQDSVPDEELNRYYPRLCP